MQVHLKLESEQRTGSFKARGAVNKVGHRLTASPRACLPIDDIHRLDSNLPCLVCTADSVHPATPATTGSRDIINWQPCISVPACMQGAETAAPRRHDSKATCVPA